MDRERIWLGYDVVDNAHFQAGAEAARARETELRAQLDLPERYFLASSRFIPKKNLPGLFRAFAHYRKTAGPEAWSLVMLGDGHLRPQLEKLRDHLGLRAVIRMPGFKQYDELPAYYGLAGAFVHASTTEQWGLVVNEAMAASLPVLVSQRCGCASDLVAEGRNGYTFDPGDEMALSAHFLRMAGSDLDREAMGRASREIIARWSPETFAEGLCQARQAALEAPKPRCGLLEKLILTLNRGGTQ
jgi:glycosyltransferase involved in cell wall biosynthesis